MSSLKDSITLVSDDSELAFRFASGVDAQRVTVAFLTIVLWDFVITTGDMVELFWNTGWNITKVMYVTNRLTAPFSTMVTLSLLAMPSPSKLLCSVFSWMGLIATVVLLILIGSAMIIRVYALWNRDKRVLIGMLTLCLFHIVFYFVGLSQAYANGVLVPETPPFTGCVVIFGSKNLWTVLIPGIIFETTVVTLIIYKTWHFATQGNIHTPLYTMLFNDGLVYYLAIAASQLLVFVCLVVPSTLTIPVLRSYSTSAVAGVACNRILARLQRLLFSKDKGQSGFPTTDAWSSATQGFAHGGRRTDKEMDHMD